MGQRCGIGKVMEGQTSQVPHQQERNRLGEREKQIRFYGESVDPEEEISRPRCYPRPVQYLLDFKIRTAWQMLNGDTTAACKGAEKTLVVCCGSGVELEMMARTGRHVIAVGLSCGAVPRARDCGRRDGRRAHRGV